MCIYLLSFGYGKYGGPSLCYMISDYVCPQPVLYIKYIICIYINSWQYIILR